MEFLVSGEAQEEKLEESFFFLSVSCRVEEKPDILVPHKH